MWSMKPVKLADAQIRKEVLACRACLATEVILYNMHENNLGEDYFQLIGVSLQDRYPQQLCCYCAALLQKFAAFKERCCYAYNLLMDASFNGQSMTVTNIRHIRASHKELHLPYALSGTENEDINEVTHIESMSDYTIDKTEVKVEFEDHSNEVNRSNTSRTKKADFSSDDDLYDDTQDIINDDDTNIENDEDIDMTIGDLIDADDETFRIVENKWMKGECKIEYLLNDVDAALDAFRKRGREKKFGKSNENDNETRVFESMPTYQQLQRFTDKDIIALANSYGFRVEFLSEEQQLQEIEEMKQRRGSVCQVCAKRLRNKVLLEEHMKKWHKPTAKYSCEICNVGYNIRNMLKCHVKWHRVTYCCQVCEFKTKNRLDMRRHQVRHKDKCFICNYCGKPFQTNITLHKHIRIWHSSSYPWCEVCAMAFTNERGLQLHGKVMHKNVKMVSCETCSAEFLCDNALEKHKRLVCNLYNCKHCGYVFGSKNLLRMHLILVHNVPSNIGPIAWDCWECDVSFHSSLGLQRHQASCKRGLHCAQCGEQCADGQLLLQHAKTHDASGLTCGECGESCKSVHDLQVHYRRHWPEAIEPGTRRRRLDAGGEPIPRKKRKFAARYFGSYDIKVWGVLDGKLVPQTPDGRVLAGHVTTEDEANTHQSMCHVCGKSYPSIALLRMHIRHAHAEAVYLCDQCPKRFTNKRALQKHVSCHSTDGVKCPKCPQVLKTSLARHMLKHTQEKRHVCQICGEAFAVSTSVKLHINTVHLKTPLPHRERKQRRQRKDTEKVKSQDKFYVKRQGDEMCRRVRKSDGRARKGDERARKGDERARKGDEKVNEVGEDEMTKVEVDEEIQYDFDYYEVEED